MSSSCYIYDSESELAPFSPASSVSLMSVGSEPSPSPSPTSSDRCPRYRAAAAQLGVASCVHPLAVHKLYFRFNNIYEERLLPLLPSVTESQVRTKAVPRPTHVTSLDPALQHRFEECVRRCWDRELEQLLASPDTRARIDINQLSAESGHTPLQAAALRGELGVVRVLVRHGADPGLASRDGWSTLHLAAYSGHPEVAQFLLLTTTSRRH